MGPARLREGGELSAQLSVLGAESERTASSFVRGARDALRWLVGGGPGPLTGVLETPIALRSVVHELAAAEAVIYGPRSAQRDYASGVEHALMWAQFATACPPTPPQRTVAVPPPRDCRPGGGAAQLSDEPAAATSMVGRA